MKIKSFLAIITAMTRRKGRKLSVVITIDILRFLFHYIMLMAWLMAYATMCSQVNEY
jgi:hypothetical protein